MARFNRFSTLGATALRSVTSVAIAAAAAATLAIAPAPASAAPVPTSRLLLTVANGESVRPAQSRVWLTCNPDGGTHPAPKAACDALRKVNGNFAKLSVNPDTACIMLYAPVTVAAEGRWRGRAVSYRHTFGNSCEMARATGPVFRSR